MMASSSPNPICELWQRQALTTFVMSPEDLRRKLKRLNRNLLIRDATVWIVCVFELAWFTGCFIVMPQRVAKVGSVLIAVGMAYMLGQIWLDQRRSRASHTAAQQSGNVNSLDFYRTELERQREFHRGIWFWSRMAVLFPGLLVFGIGAIVVFPWPQNLAGWVVTGVTVAIAPISIRLNLTKSRNYQRELDRLQALGQPPGGPQSLTLGRGTNSA